MTTRWHPDTCECVLEYDNIINDQVINPKVIKKCSAHTSHSNDKVFDIVSNENRRKNFTLWEAQQIDPAIKIDDYHWRFDNERVLHIDFKNPITPTRKISLQGRLNTRFGMNKTIVE